MVFVRNPVAPTAGEGLLEQLKQTRRLRWKKLTLIQIASEDSGHNSERILVLSRHKFNTNPSPFAMNRTKHGLHDVPWNYLTPWFGRDLLKLLEIHNYLAFSFLYSFFWSR